MATQNVTPSSIRQRLNCPVCGKQADRYVEVIASARSLRLRNDGAIEVEGYYETEGWDEDNIGLSLCCPEGHVWPLPPDIAARIEFV